MATFLAIIWPIPLLLIALAAGVVFLRGRVAAEGGLQPPYEGTQTHDGEAEVSQQGPVTELVSWEAVAPQAVEGRVPEAVAPPEDDAVDEALAVDDEALAVDEVVAVDQAPEQPDPGSTQR